MTSHTQLILIGSLLASPLHVLGQGPGQKIVVLLGESKNPAWGKGGDQTGRENKYHFLAFSRNRGSLASVNIHPSPGLAWVQALQFIIYMLTPLQPQSGPSSTFHYTFSEPQFLIMPKNLQSHIGDETWSGILALPPP